jgi:hypothetical protein
MKAFSEGWPAGGSRTAGHRRGGHERPGGDLQSGQHGGVGTSNLTLNAGGATIECPSVTLEGNTGLDSDRITDLALVFEQPCSFGGGGVTVDCSGTLTLIADPDADDTGTVELNHDFRCEFSTAVCTVTVEGFQETQPKNTFLDEANDLLYMDWVVRATRTGNILCGPAEGTMSITSDSAVTPPELTIDP